MHSNSSRLTLALLTVLTVAPVARAADTVAAPAAPPEAKRPAITLKIGDAAPKLAAGQWIQGEPVKEFARDKVYVVEFWATWCGPCKVSIPHLNELHQQFKDKGVVFIGQDCWERDDALVEPFVKKMADKMSYRVALDDKAGGGKGAMAETWMMAAGQTGIPSAFIVDKQGKIAWIGHPMKLEPALLEEVLAGKHDLAKTARAHEAELEQKQAAQANARQLSALQGEFSRQLTASQWEEAEATLAKIDKLTRDLSPNMRARYGIQRLRLFLARKDVDGAVKFAKGVIDSNPHDPLIEISIATQLANLPDVHGPALALAAKIAEDGYAAGGSTGSLFTVILARVKMLQGDKDQAIALQTKAISSLPDTLPEASRQRYQTTLEAYQAGKLPPSSTAR
jgi:thiol-disulfide isomerase/thioredoxin